MDKVEVAFDEEKVFNSTLSELAGMITKAFEVKGVPIENVGTFVSVKRGNISVKVNFEDGTIIYTWTPEDSSTMTKAFQAEVGEAKFEAK